MPIYDFECKACGAIQELARSISEYDTPVTCDHCSAEMRQIISPTNVNVSVCQFQAHYNHGLGIEAHRPSDIKEHLRRIKGETGKEIVEVGNDSLKSIKKKRTPYTLD